MDFVRIPQYVINVSLEILGLNRFNANVYNIMIILTFRKACRITLSNCQFCTSSLNCTSCEEGYYVTEYNNCFSIFLKNIYFLNKSLQLFSLQNMCEYINIMHFLFRWKIFHAKFIQVQCNL